MYLDAERDTQNPYTQDTIADAKIVREDLNSAQDVMKRDWDRYYRPTERFLETQYAKIGQSVGKNIASKINIQPTTTAVTPTQAQPTTVINEDQPNLKQPIKPTKTKEELIKLLENDI